MKWIGLRLYVTIQLYLTYNKYMRVVSTRRYYYKRFPIEL